MTVYELLPILDNPLFRGLYMPYVNGEDPLTFMPKGWNNKENYFTWEAPRFLPTWPDPPPMVEGLVRSFNDYPGINLGTPAFSQRAVDILRDLLEPYGELLPVRHPIGMFYVYNCTNLLNCLDLNKSVYSYTAKTHLLSIQQYAFIESQVRDQAFFRVRPTPSHLMCTDVVAERVKKHGMLGFRFVPLWSPDKKYKEYVVELKRTRLKAAKLRPVEGPPVPVKGNTVVLRLYLEKKKPTKEETARVERIMDEIEAKLYDPNKGAQDYFGNIEGHDVVDHEIRIFMSAPDCHRLVEHLRPYLKKLPWKGRYQVLKRFGEYVDETAREEYVRL